MINSLPEHINLLTKAQITNRASATGRLTCLTKSFVVAENVVSSINLSGEHPIHSPSRNVNTYKRGDSV